MAPDEPGSPASGDAPPVPPPDPAPRLFAVVGIGASAGGLEAFSQLLRHLPANSGMAYVLVQHLDPSHESHLTGLLARAAEMPVVEASEGQAVEPDHVYVIPPNTLLGISRGVLRLLPRIEGRSPNMPVDFFLCALAEDLGSQAIGAVLSGTGSDGTLGLRAIKAAGGVTFAQDATAQHEGMPRSAVLSGYVDFVLPPREMAREMVRVGKHPYLKGGLSAIAAQEPTERDNALATLFRLLHRATRVDYAHYKRSTIMRRIQRRLILHRLDRLEEYVAHLREHPEEIEALHQDLLIHVTRFFRDPEVFERLAVDVFPALMKDRPPEAAIRVWVPGCSTGEEVYTLAIRLLEFLGDRAGATPIKIFATDLSESILERARAGKYPEAISADVPPDRLRRFFVKDSGGYQISKALRDLCVFAQHDMTRDPPFSNLDLVSCRNVLIYLGPVLQKRALPLFHYALKNPGFLVLGDSETIGPRTDLFSAVDSVHRIYAKRPGPSREALAFSAEDMPFGPPLGSVRATREAVSGLDIQREADRALLARYAPAGVVVNEDMEILSFRGQTGSFLAPAAGAPSLNLLKMAREGLLVALRTAVDEVRRTGAPARREGVRVRTDAHFVDVDLQVIPVMVAQQRCFAVLFEEIAGPPAEGPVARPSRAGGVEPSPEGDGDRRVSQLQQELSATREYLQAIIEKLEVSNEELKAANEEIISANEELQSTNEEMQSSREELQASNEELNTVNEELQHRNREVAQLADDLNNLLRSVLIPIVMVGPGLRIRSFTPSAAEPFSLIATDLGRPIGDIRPKLVGVDLGRWIAEVLESLVAREAEVRDQDGRWYRLFVRPYRTQEDRIAGAVVGLLDIDALKRGEAQLRQAREHAESIIATVSMPLAVLDADRRVVSANRAFYETSATTAADTEGRRLEELGARHWDIAPLLGLLDEAVRQDRPFAGLVVEPDIPALGSRRVLISGRRLARPEEESPLLLVAFEDVTDRHRLELSLRQAQKMEAIGHLAGGIAHEFNNLLTVVNGYSALLLERLSADLPATDKVKRIAQAGERAAALTRQLLAFGSKQIIAPRRLDLNALVAEVVPTLRPLLGERIRLTLVDGPGLGDVLADPGVIERTLVTLAGNARAAMPRGGELSIETRNVDLNESLLWQHPEASPGPYVLLAARDTGAGMDAETLARVFEPFGTTKGLVEGSGLGLAAMYGGIRQSGGFIDVDSAPGRGTTFTIHLPRLPASPGAEAPAAGVTAAAKGSETVLLAKDADEVRELARDILQRAGYTVLEARDGAAAFEVAGRYRGPIHLLVTDVRMPRRGGRELADLLVSARPDLKVLFVSGYLQDPSLDERVAAGAAFL